MIDITNSDLYLACLDALTTHKRHSRQFKGRFTQLFLAFKFYQNVLPSMYSNQFISTKSLQTLLDDLYTKESRERDDCVLMLFEGRYKALTGIVGRGNTVPQNTWRNNFNLQKGIGCYAPPGDLVSPAFLNQSRVDCRYLRPAAQGSLSGATCDLCPTDASYRNEDHRKWLRLNTKGRGYAVVDTSNIENFLPYIVPEGLRIPILPLVVALYHDVKVGLAIASRDRIDLRDFTTDFNFSTEEFHSYFDDSFDNPANQMLLNNFAVTTYNRLQADNIIAPLVPVVPPPDHDRAPILTGIQTTPPNVNTGWEAEQFVSETLRRDGWTVYDVSRQRMGYDLLVRKGSQTLYVDVKSSLGQCSPTLTSLEWEKAKTYREEYVLAIIEDFNPQGVNRILWVRDPYGTCISSERTVVEHKITRTSWKEATIKDL